MSTTAFAHASLIEKLQFHLKDKQYAPAIQRRYSALAIHFLDYCDREHLAIDTIRSETITHFLQQRYRLFCRRHEEPTPIHEWRKRYTGAIHMLLRLVHGKWAIDDLPKTALEAFHCVIIDDYDTWLRDVRGLQPKTRAKRTKHALRFLTSLGLQANQQLLASLNVRQIDAYLQECCDGLRRASIEDHTVCLRDFLRHLYRSGRIATDLAGTVIGPRIYEHEGIPPALDADKVLRVLKATREDRSPAGLRDHAILTLLATYGLRAAEIVGLRLEDFDWRREILTVHHSKTGTYSDLPLLPEPGEAVLRYLREGRPSSAHREVFLHAQAPHCPFKGGSGLYWVTSTRLRAAGIIPQGRKGPHAFRHARAVSLLRSGVPLNVIGDVLGHRSASATGGYLKLATEDLRTIGLEIPGGVSQ
jgi:integrase/recombinase XerD